MIPEACEQGEVTDHSKAEVFEFKEEEKRRHYLSIPFPPPSIKI